ncbi:MAG TPA: acyltransferase family protein [Chitinophagaceae bacterium]|nr:acyltransferase family protein [Chitinophagaceae bacterium]
MPGVSTSRQAYLDWLRILAILGVLFFHSAMPYVAEWGWHIKNRETSHILLECNAFLHRFRMPLLFFISGTVSYYMLQNRTGGGFIGLRFRRLFIPLLLGMLVLVPPQVYMERLTEGFHGNFWSFYPSIFTTGAYPQGNMSWHHLWFIAYLLLYDLLCAPLFVWLISARGRRFLQRLDFLAKGRRIYLMALPGILVYGLLALKYPETNDLVHDYAFLPYWLLFLLAGFLCVAHPRFMDSLERNRRDSLAMALVSLVAINYLRWNHLEPWVFLRNYASDWRSYATMALSAFCAWAWVLTAIGYGKRYLNRPSRHLAYLNQAVYPFYILHQTVIVILTYYVVQAPDGIALKYGFTVLATFLLSLGLYHLFIRPYRVMRFLFGMKPPDREPRRRKEPAMPAGRSRMAEIPAAS